jgi:hypothetical protein
MQIALDITGVCFIAGVNMRDKILVEIYLSLIFQARQVYGPIEILTEGLGVLPKPELRAEKLTKKRCFFVPPPGGIQANDESGG